MITAKRAMDSIGRYIREFSQYIPSNDIRLEEIEPDDEKREWIITVSYPENPLTESKRVYKRFRVDGSEMGEAEVKSMKNATPEVPF
ncbi:hypothetical protein [Methylocystis iwaonis]|uniref:hypothetical protein n=1 Tax=Methylocystis iwaonis TaxID=2885079 RepID=UPI002E7B97DD|nr:hypothetical protein [Methylocystis iwaonis]